MNVQRKIVSAVAALATTSLLLSCGCSPPSASESPSEVVESRKRVAVRCLVIDDEPLAAALRRHWGARAEGELVVTSLSSEAFFATAPTRLGADLVVYPSELLGELAMRDLIVPLEPEQLSDPRLGRSDLFPLLIDAEARWGSRTYAVPFGSPSLVLLYRPAELEALSIAAPATWEEYQAAVVRIADSLDSPARHATIEPLGEGWAGRMLLARAAAYARHRSQYSSLFDLRSMDPLIAGPPFTRALAELVAAAKFAPAEAADFGPTEVYREFVAGRSALAVAWPQQLSDDAPRRAEDKMGFAELPGSVEMFDSRSGAWEQRGEDEDRRIALVAASGRLGSVTRECRQAKASATMLLFFCGAEMGRQVSAESEATMVYRASQIDAVADWSDPVLGAEANRQFAEVLRGTQSRRGWLSCLRIPGAAEYMAALDLAVHRSLGGEVTPENALSAAAETWREITLRYGVEHQAAAYARSLGLER